MRSHQSRLICNSEELRKGVEALLFLNHRPMAVREIAEVVERPHEEIEEALEDLMRSYAERGITIRRVAGGYQMVTSAACTLIVEKFHRTTFKSHLTPSLLEVLAVIAYRQPVTRAQVEAIRGVKLSKALHLLLTLKLIRFVGKADAPGRPPLYGTTKEFLHYFGLNSLEDLPPLEHFSTL